jgi:hypothetical protein
MISVAMLIPRAIRELLTASETGKITVRRPLMVTQLVNQ